MRKKSLKLFYFLFDGWIGGMECGCGWVGGGGRVSPGVKRNVRRKPVSPPEVADLEVK